MNAHDYISSGLLEAYVLGALSEVEFEQVAGAICRFPEVATEVALLEESLFHQVEQGAVAPPPALENQIWALLEQQPVQVTATPQAPKSIPLPPPVAAPERQEQHTVARKRFPLGMAAAVALLIGSVGATIITYRNGQTRERELLAANQRLERDRSELSTQVASFRERYSSEAEMAADPAMQTVAMRGLKPEQPMAATMYWNAAKQQAYVSVQKLPPAPQGMQYQLWAIADGKPVSLGMIENSVALDGGMQEVALPVAAGQAFAVSLEKAGGVPSPTAERIYMMGKVPA